MAHGSQDDAEEEYIYDIRDTNVQCVYLQTVAVIHSYTSFLTTMATAPNPVKVAKGYVASRDTAVIEERLYCHHNVDTVFEDKGMGDTAVIEEGLHCYHNVDTVFVDKGAGKLTHIGPEAPQVS